MNLELKRELFYYRIIAEYQDDSTFIYAEQEDFQNLMLLVGQLELDELEEDLSNEE